MKPGKLFILCCFILMLLCFQQLSVAVTTHTAKATKTTHRKQRITTSETLPTHESRQYYLQHIANILGWVSSQELCFLCKGYFKDPWIISRYPHPEAINKESAIITAQGPSTVTAKGVSILRKDVVVTQPGRIIKADKAYIYRDVKTGHITKIILIGHVHLHEAGKLIVADRGTLTLYPKTAILMNVAYRVYSGKSLISQFNYPFSGWGTAKHAVRDAAGVITLRHATYSTCNPTDPTWWLSASTIVLNKQTHRGKAYNAVLRFGGLPIFYLPYFNFPIDNYRKTGFLTPKIGLSNQSGGIFSIPFYWNIAPNYDLTLTPEIMTKRGLDMHALFRFLSVRSNGNIYFSYLPNDKVFQEFRESTLNTFSSAVLAQQPFFIPYVNQIKKAKNQRGFFSMNDTTVFNSEWSSHVILNYVTDPYYFQDLGGQIHIGSLVNQLLNRIDLQYSDLHWQFNSMLQAYQTLHLINQTQNPALDQYYRLPDLNADGYYPNIARDTDFNFNAEAVNFDYQSSFTPNQPIGQRFHTRPGFSFPFYFASGYVNPQIWADATAYHTAHLQPGQAQAASRLLPIFDVDSGLYFDRDFHIGNQAYIQTLEPRFFYLFVPYQNQNRLPNFDTVLLPFSFEQLFALNQYTGDDRLQNANQMSFALTSRILDADTSDAVLTANIGFIYYIQNQRVCLSTNCDLPNNRFSPIISELIFNPNPNWSLSGNLAWDPNLQQTNNASVALGYHGRGSFQIGYLFTHGNAMSIIAPLIGSPTSSIFSNNTSQLTIATGWPIIRKWSAIAYWDYNFTQHRTDRYTFGVQYDTCCWALSFATQRSFTGTTLDPTGNPKNTYETSFLVQLQLKGLGDFGNLSGVTKTLFSGINDNLTNYMR